MMALHFARIIVIILALLACRFLPFLPGAYDGLAVTLSLMAMTFSWAALLLVLIGVCWLIYEFGWRSPAPSGNYYFSLVSLIAASLVMLVVALSAFATFSFSLGLITLAFWGAVVLKFAPGLKRLKTSAGSGVQPAPFYLVCIPIVVALAQWALVPRATEFSRNYAIRQSAALINDIEEYHRANGRYPASLAALWPDYKPGVIGIAQYYYEPYGEAYNLYFEQIAVPIGAQEIVMYNKRDEHHFPSHANDILRWTPEQLRSRKSYLSLQDTTSPHWKYFWFD